MRDSEYCEAYPVWVGVGEVEFQFNDWAIDKIAQSLRAARVAAASIAATEDEYETANASSGRSYFTLARYPCMLDGYETDDDTWWRAIRNINRWLSRWGYRPLRTPE